MQIKCGQCGTLHDLERIEGMESVRCAHCGHAIDYLDMAAESTGPATVCEGRFDNDADGFAQQARQALRERMLVVCTHCGGRIRVAKRLAGQVIHCTSCSKELRVPEAVAEDQVDISYLISPGDVVMGQDPHAVIGWRARAARRRQWASKQRIQLAMKVLAAVVLAALIGSVVWHGAKSSSPEKDYLSREPLSPETYESPSAHVANVAPPDVPNASAAVTSPEAPTGPGATLVGEPAWSVFASGKYYPAPPGRRYCTISVRLQSPDEKPLRFAPAEAAKLVLGNVTHACLGEPVENAQLPVRCRQRTIELPAAHHATVRLLFDLPEAAGRGTLHLDGLGELAVALAAPAGAKASPAGRFVEAPPRNLKVLLSDPVMAVIQSAAQQELRIRKSGNVFDVRIDEAEVIGQARPAGGDVYTVTLRHGPHSIEGALRLLPDGRQIVLYLSNAPMHQITYQRKQENESPPADDGANPPAEENDNQPQFFGV
ncbi:MAG: hypothetical protein JW849_07355 [Phycisphaerae bacterium]|nr:hypothetical protein [Phycisphaerae bacterium]